MSDRQSWHDYFMNIANTVSTRGTCDRKRVGCLIVTENRIIATGYNGSISGHPHCDEIGHDIQDGHCVRTIHAEINAIAQAARFGLKLDGASVYVNTYPCWNCYKSLCLAGINTIYVNDVYRKDERITKVMASWSTTGRGAKSIPVKEPHEWQTDTSSF